MVNLREGMRAGDLEDLVLPLVSIDEYESKVSEKAVVVGFYVHDKDAADDLNRFIQKSPVQLLDTDVSPAPDQHGYYLVFVELENDRRIVDNIEDIVNEVTPLANTDEWHMQLRGSDGTMPFSRKVLSRRFAEMRDDEIVDDSQEDDTEHRVMEFLSHSDLSSAVVEDERVVLSSPQVEFHGVIAGIGDVETLMVENGLEDAAFSLDLHHVAECKRISQMLGEGWVSSRIGGHILVQRQGEEIALLLRKPLLQ